MYQVTSEGRDKRISGTSPAYSLLRNVYFVASFAHFVVELRLSYMRKPGRRYCTKRMIFSRSAILYLLGKRPMADERDKEWDAFKTAHSRARKGAPPDRRRLFMRKK